MFIVCIDTQKSAAAVEVSDAAEAGRIEDPSLCVVDDVGAATTSAAVELTFGGVTNGAGVEDGRSTIAL
jgi:hypothetical protein